MTNAPDEMTVRAFAIADEAMFELLMGECFHHDEHRTVLSMADDDCSEVNSLAEASQAIQDAVAWLQPRGYIELASDDSVEHIIVQRRPGEE